jgi:hypothetical protein
MQISVIRPGSMVSIPHGEISQAFVTQVAIFGDNHITYRVMWWDQGERVEAWLEAFEVSAEPPNWMPVGFVLRTL